MNSDTEFVLFLSALTSLFILYGIISAAVSGIKKELKRQTLIMGLMAQKEGITADELNQIMK
jgi:hypothetical protein